MAETLLIVFIAFILLGMPISIAMAVGALGASFFFPVLNPIIIPTRFVGLLSIPICCCRRRYSSWPAISRRGAALPMP